MKSFVILAIGLAAVSGRAQQPDFPQSPRPGDDGPRGPGGPGGGRMMQERKLVSRFDKDGDKRLSASERAEARAYAKEQSARRPGRRGGPPGGAEAESTGPGKRVEKADVKQVTGGLYDTSILRTIFLDFESQDWEAELSDFIRTDVEVPATLTVDGKAYPDVGVSFRGASSLMMVPAGSKRSLNISLDYLNEDQKVQGSKTLNLLNAHGDPSFMRTVLYFHVAHALKMPAPQANFVRVVINGESWGLYTNAQQFDKALIAEHFPSSKGSRWKVPGSPQGRGGLEYLGDDEEPYQRRYELKSGNKDKSWAALIELCRTLNETPMDKLEGALKPMLDVEGVLWFLALENALVNTDGYWIRASDYCIYLDEEGVFHVLPHDANETFLPGMGPRGGPGGPPGGGPPGGRGPDDRPREGQPDDRPAPRAQAQVDPLIGLDDETKPLRSRLLKVPALRESYLRKVKIIATDWLDWEKVGPIVEQYRSLIEQEVEADTRKLSTFEAFKRSLTGVQQPVPQGEGQPRQPRGRPSLEQFARQRREYLLNYSAIKNLDAPADR
jgi:hypothetical protein